MRYLEQAFFLESIGIWNCMDALSVDLGVSGGLFLDFGVFCQAGLSVRAHVSIGSDVWCKTWAFTSPGELRGGQSCMGGSTHYPLETIVARLVDQRESSLPLGQVCGQPSLV